MIKLQYGIYQWIRLNELYKLMIFFFQVGFRNFGRNPKNIQTGVNIDQIAMCYISWMDLTRHGLQTNEKFLFSNFGIIFRISYNFLK